MSTLTEEAIEFRCTGCWQTNFIPVSYAGSKVPCGNCAVEVLVPEATPERVRSPEQVEAALVPAIAEDYAEISPSASDATLMRHVRRDNNTPLAERRFGRYPNASIWMRLVANLVDSLYVFALLVAGFGMVFAAYSTGVLAAPSAGGSENIDWGMLAVLYFPVLVGSIVQWNLITTRGQSIGKYLCGLRIVTMDGRLPGFVHGVALRCWLCTLFCAIPGFSLVDCLFIFGSANRCLHDYMAGTRVVPAW